MHHTYTLQMLCINRISALDLLPRINLSSLAILQQKNQERNILCLHKYRLSTHTSFNRSRL